MRTKTSLLMFFVLFCSIETFTQTSISISDLDDTVVRYTDNQNNTIYEMGGGDYDDDIGQRLNSVYGYTGQYRTQHSFSLGTIPSNATITSAKIQYELSNWNQSYQFAIILLDQSYAYQYLWDEIGSSPLLFSNLSYNGGETTSTQDLINAINNARGNGGVLYLGAASQGENNGDSYAKVNLILKIVYTVPIQSVNITAQNNFIYGTIKVGVDLPATQHNSPFPFPANVGQTVNLEAQNQSYSGYERVWNNYAPNSQSNWWKNGVEIPGSINYNYSFQATQNDDDANYQAGLRKNYAITRNDQTEFDGSNSIIAAQIVEQNSGYISAPLQQTINNNSYNFAGWVGWNQSSASVYITPTQNTTYSTLYKIPHKSNYANAFSNNSQRKFVRTPDGTFHLVYESMGCTWYERSTDNGVSWQIMNNGKPLRDNSKNPTIAYQGNTVFIALQFSTGFKFYWFNNAGGFEAADSIINPGGEVIDYQSDVSPAIEIKSDRLLIVYRNNGLKYNFYRWYAAGNGDISFLEDGSILNSDANSLTPTLAVNKNTSDYNFHLAWGQGDNIIRYQKITSSDGLRLEQSNSYYKSNLAQYSGYTKNYMPTLAILNDDLARIAWVGERNESGGGEGELNKITIAPPTKKTVFRGINNDYNFWYFGSAVTSASVQSTGDNNYYIVWSGSGGTSMVSNYTAFNPVKSLSASGNQVHVASGSTTSNTYAMMFNNTALPYNFTMSNNLASYYQANKENAGGYVFCGREGVVTKDTAHFYYTIGDVSVDNTTIQFKEINEQTLFNSNEDILAYLETEPFELNNNSTFLYSVQYGLTENASSVFGNDGNVNFKVKLIDAETNQLISMFDDVTYNNENKLPYNSIQYSVNTSGIGNRTVKLVLSIEDNIGCTYSVANLIDASSIMPKAVRQEIGLGENINVTEYDLSQNYPNPFNPSTTIRYAIPKDGMVTLKIYDILGREIKTLVNEYKTKGLYEVNFDASSLASGMYIYEISSGDYKASKKMTLIK